MPTYYLAVDIGASSGRHILGWIEDGKIQLEEVYRFSNGMIEKNGHLCWDHESLAQNVVEGMKRCAEIGKIPSYMGIDTWGVDYVLLDKDGKVIGDAIGYRDARNALAMPEVDKIVSKEELYARTGIQRLDYNTVFQLMADKMHRPEDLAAAEKLLMIPDYLGYVLTGVAHQEYTNATTGALVNLGTGVLGIYFRYNIIDFVKNTVNEKDYYISFSIDNIQQHTTDYITVDDEFYLAADGRLLGKLTKESDNQSALNITPASAFFTDSMGKTVEVFYPNETRVNAKGRLLCRGSYSEEGGFSLDGTVNVSPGQSIAVYSEEITVTMRILSIEEVDA